jgi:hypothetical protein
VRSSSERPEPPYTNARPPGSRDGSSPSHLITGPRPSGWTCCAEAGIAHFWRVEESDGKPVVYVYELDPATKAYALTGIHHGKLSVPVPCEIGIDLDALPR